MENAELVSLFLDFANAHTWADARASLASRPALLGSDGLARLDRYVDGLSPAAGALVRPALDVLHRCRAVGTGRAFDAIAGSVKTSFFVPPALEPILGRALAAARRRDVPTREDLDEAGAAFAAVLDDAAFVSAPPSIRLIILDEAMPVEVQLHAQTRSLPASELVMKCMLLAADLLPENSSRRHALLRSAAPAIVTYVERIRDRDDANRAVALLTELTAGRTAEDLNLRLALVQTLLNRHLRFRDPTDLEVAIDSVTTLAKVTTGEGVASSLSLFAQALMYRFRRTGSDEDLNRAVDLFDQAIAERSSGHPAIANDWHNFGSAFRARFQRHSDPADVDRALSALRKAIELAPAGSDGLPGHRGQLAMILHDRYKQRGDREDLRDAKAEVGLALRGSLTSSIDLPTLHALAAACEVAEYLVDGRPGALDDAIAAHRRSVAAFPDSACGVGKFIGNLSYAIRLRYEADGRPEDLREATELARWAVAEESKVSTVLSGQWHGLGVCLLESYHRDGRPADLDEAIHALDEAVQSHPPDAVGIGIFLTSRGNARLERHQARGDQADFDGAVADYQAALDSTTSGSADRALLVGNLAGSFHELFRRTGEARYVRSAVEAGREALRLTSANSPDRPRHQSALGEALRTLYRFDKNRADLDEAAAVSEAAAEATTPGSGRRAVFMGNLAAVLADRYGETGDALELDRAIDAWSDAIASSPEHSTSRADYWTGLGSTLGMRISRAASTGDPERAAHALRMAVETTPPTSPSLAGRLNNLGVHLVARADRGDQLAGAEAIEMFERAVTIGLRHGPATKSATLAAAEHAWLLHAACHATFTPAAPLDSHLELAGGSTLRLAELLDGTARLPVARLAILSACQTAMTDFQRLPDEAIGFPAGFLQAGVPGVVGSLWPVDDVATCLLVARFAEVLFARAPGAPIAPREPAAALRDAQRWLRRATREELLSALNRILDLAWPDADSDRGSAFRLRAIYTIGESGGPGGAPFESDPFAWAAFAAYGA